MRKTALLGALLGAFVLTGCATGGFDPDATRDGAQTQLTLGQAFADRLLEVRPEHRALRVCLLAAGASELMFDRAVRGGGEAAGMLGRIDTMYGAVLRARRGSEYWAETEMANAAFVFAQVFEGAGRERLGRVLLGGLSLTNYIATARRGAVAAYKASAMLRDAEAMIRGLEAETLRAEQLWGACEERIVLNRDALRNMTGAAPLPE